MPDNDDISIKERDGTAGSSPSTGKRALVLTLAALLLLVSTASSAQVTVAGSRTSSIIGAISGEQMMDTITDLEDFGSRAFYLDSAKYAAAYIYGKFAGAGLYVEYQNFALGDRIVANIVAVLNGTSSEAPAFLFGAHYDSENFMVENYSDALNMSAPGADDDASGVAAVLELARVLADTRLRNTVKFVAFTAEEYGYDSSGGLRGSAYYVAQEKAAGTEYIGSAILDMIGYKDSEMNIVFGIANKEGNVFAEHVVKAIDNHKMNVTVNVRVDATITFSDHSSFWRAGYPSMLFIEELSDSTHQPVNPFYHTSDDTSDRLSIDQIEEFTRAMAAGLLGLLGPQGSSLVPVIFLIVVIAAAVAAAFSYQARKRKKG